MTVVRRPAGAAPPKPPQADQKMSESRIPIAPTIRRIQPIEFMVVATSRIAPAAIRSRLTLMPMGASFLEWSPMQRAGARRGFALGHLAPAGVGAAERHLVGVLEVAADGEAAGETR